MINNSGINRIIRTMQNENVIVMSNKFKEVQDYDK